MRGASKSGRQQMVLFRNRLDRTVKTQNNRVVCATILPSFKKTRRAHRRQAGSKVKVECGGAPLDVTSSHCGTEWVNRKLGPVRGVRERESKRTSEQSAACRRSPDGGREETPSKKAKKNPFLSSRCGHLEIFFKVGFFLFLFRLTSFLADPPLPDCDQGDNVSHNHQGREHTSRGARRHRACYQSGESSPVVFLEDRLTSRGSQTGGGGGGGSKRGGGVKGEVGGEGRGRSVGGEREGGRVLGVWCHP